MWYYFCDGQCVGPISQNLLISKFDLSDIPHSTLVWGTVSGEWLPVRDVLKFVAARTIKPNLTSPQLVWTLTYNVANQAAD